MAVILARGGERGVQRGAAHRVVDDIEALSVRVLRHVLRHSVRAVVDGRRAVSLNDLALAGAARGEYLCAMGQGDLHRDMAHAAGAAVHQHALAGADAGAIDQPLPCRDEDQRQGGRLAHREVARLDGQQVGIDGGIFGQRALDATDAARHAIHFVARLEVMDAQADGCHHAGQVDPQHGWQFGLGMSRLAGRDLDIERIDAAGPDLHQHLAGPGLRAGDPFQRQGSVVGVQDGRLHEGCGGHDWFPLREIGIACG